MFFLSIAGLRAPAATGHTSTSPVLPSEAAARVARSSTASTVESTTPATGRIAPARTVVATSVGRRLGASRLHDDVLAIHGVRVGRDGSLVSLDSLVLDKGAVLKASSQRVVTGRGKARRAAYLLAVDVKISQLAMRSQGTSKVGVLDLIRHVLDVSHSAVLLGKIARDGQGPVLALGISACRLPSG